MILKEKGASAEMTDVSKDVKISTKWSGNIDFDTAALFVRKDGSKGIVYYGTAGAGETHGYLDKEPFIMLDKDSLTGGEENLVVSAKAVEMNKRIHLVVWDYKAISGNKKPSFNTSDLKVHIGDHEVHPKVGEKCNFVEMAVIQNNDGKVSIINKSIEGELSKVDDTDMWRVIEAV